jgi:hypothetical protein
MIAMTVEIRKPVGPQWGCNWVRYVVGHPREPGLPLDVEIPIPTGALKVSAAEVFDADEAAELFQVYHQSGTIPTGYASGAVRSRASRCRSGWATRLATI